MPHADNEAMVETPGAGLGPPPQQSGSLFAWDERLTLAEFARRYFVWPSEEPRPGTGVRWSESALEEEVTSHLAWWHRRSTVPPADRCVEAYSEARVLVIGLQSDTGCVQAGVDVNGWFFRDAASALEYLLQLHRWSELDRSEQASFLRRWMPRILLGFEDWQIVRRDEWLLFSEADHEVVMESAQATNDASRGSEAWGRYRRVTWRVNRSGTAEQVDSWEAPCSSSARCGRDLWHEHLLKSAPVFVDGAVEIRGWISPGVVSRIFGENRRVLRSCYGQALRDDPTLPAVEFLVWIMLSEDGDMSGARLIPGDVGNETLRECILGRVRRFRFPSDGYGPVEIAYPVSLWTDDGSHANTRVGSWRPGRIVETE